MSRTYHRTRTPAGTAITVRRDGAGYLLTVGQGQRMRRISREEAAGLCAALAAALGAAVTGLPGWAADARIEVSDT